MKKRKYLANGQEVQVNQTLTNGFLYQHVLILTEARDDEFLSEEIYFIKKLYEIPPTNKYADVIKKLTKEITALNNQLINIHKKIEDVKLIESENASKYKQFEALQRLHDYIDGKITHYIYVGYDIKISEFKETKSTYGRKDIKLLSLFGNTKGDLQWRLNYYSDGSGDSEHVIPCCGINEAMQFAQTRIDQICENDKVCDNTIKIAKMYKLHISDNALKSYREKQKKGFSKNISDAKAKIKEWETEIKNL